MELSFEKIDNNGSYKLDVSNLNTEIIIGKTVSGTKINLTLIHIMVILALIIIMEVLYSKQIAEIIF